MKERQEIKFYFATFSSAGILREINLDTLQHDDLE